MKTDIHPYRLRAYHNPDNAPWSVIPPGWRFLYADEAGRHQGKPCRLWLPGYAAFRKQEAAGDFIGFTYIVPVSA